MAFGSTHSAIRELSPGESYESCWVQITLGGGAGALEYVDKDKNHYLLRQ
jgi:hypothetical protein